MKTLALIGTSLAVITTGTLLAVNTMNNEQVSQQVVQEPQIVTEPVESKATEVQPVASDQIVVTATVPENNQQVTQDVQPEVAPTPTPAPAYVVDPWKVNLFKYASIPEDQWESADKLITEISGWCLYKNDTTPVCNDVYIPKDKSERFGFCLLPYGTAVTFGVITPPHHPDTQIITCNLYVKNFYGDWNKAYQEWPR